MDGKLRQYATLALKEYYSKHRICIQDPISGHVDYFTSDDFFDLEKISELTVEQKEEYDSLLSALEIIKKRSERSLEGKD